MTKNIQARGFLRLGVEPSNFLGFTQRRWVFVRPLGNPIELSKPPGQYIPIAMKGKSTISDGTVAPPHQKLERKEGNKYWLKNNK